MKICELPVGTEAAGIGGHSGKHADRITPAAQGGEFRWWLAGMTPVSRAGAMQVYKEHYMLTYDDVALLINGGVQLMGQADLEALRDSDTTIRILRHGQTEGEWMRIEPSCKSDSLKALVDDGRVLFIQAGSLGTVTPFQFLQKMIDTVAGYGGTVRAVASSSVNVSMAVDIHPDHAESLCKALSGFAEVIADREAEMLTIIGIGEQEGFGRRAIELLKDIPVLMISYEEGDRTASAVLQASDRAKALSIWGELCLGRPLGDDEPSGMCGGFIG